MLTSGLMAFVKKYCPEAIVSPARGVRSFVRSRLLSKRFGRPQESAIWQRGYAPASIINEPISSISLAHYFDLVLSFDHSDPVAMDCAHSLFIVGSVLARKPRQILELGVGSGYLTKSLLQALRYNMRGSLTTVDNWHDTGGTEPFLAKELGRAGFRVTCSGEEEFVHRAPTDYYDFLISDADHFNSQKWLNQHLRIVKRDGFLFFHDTNQPETFPGLATLTGKIRRLGLPHFHFTENSRQDERCHRGLLFVINKK